PAKLDSDSVLYGTRNLFRSSNALCCPRKKLEFTIVSDRSDSGRDSSGNPKLDPFPGRLNTEFADMMSIGLSEAVLLAVIRSPVRSPTRRPIAAESESTNASTSAWLGVKPSTAIDGRKTTA